MINFSELRSEELLCERGFDCACGRHHSADMKFLRIGHDAIKSVPEALEKIGSRKPFVVCGPNGYKAAGETVVRLLEEAGIPYKLHIIPCKKGERIAPSEFAAGSIILNFDPDCDLILGVGSGVINDLCKVVGKATGNPCAIIGTAPSMDGYASASSAMEVNNIKVSLPEQLPCAVICDTGIMAQAPMRLLWAGLGDMMAKYTALCEWRLANLVAGEYYCEEIAKLVRASLEKIAEGADKVMERNEHSVATIAEGLVLSGLGMAFAGVSRPASGLDHYFSHCWEMVAIARGQESDLHGIQVGIGTLLTMKIYQHMRTIRPTMEHAIAAADAFDEAAWEANIRRVFVDTADGIIEMEKEAGKNLREGRLQRAKTIIDNWDNILKIMDEELPAYEEVYGIMTHAGMPLMPQDIGLSVDDAIDAFICSRDIRNKYLTSSLIWDIGYMDEFALWLRSELEK